MKRHGRCSISGSSGAIEIPLLPSFLYLFSKTEDVPRSACGQTSSVKGRSRLVATDPIRSEDSVRRGV